MNGGGSVERDDRFSSGGREEGRIWSLSPVLFSGGREDETEGVFGAAFS
jgi:hypothetical protein